MEGTATLFGALLTPTFLKATCLVRHLAFWETGTIWKYTISIFTSCYIFPMPVVIVIFVKVDYTKGDDGIWHPSYILYDKCRIHRHHQPKLFRIEQESCHTANPAVARRIRGNPYECIVPTLVLHGIFGKTCPIC